MKKYLTYRTARLGGYVGLALFIASFFLPARSLWDIVLSSLGWVLVVIDLAATAHQNGYEKGHREARLIITEEVSARRAAEWTKRVWAEQAVPSEHEPFEAKTFREGAS